MTAILDAFRAGVDAGLDEDAIKLSMIQAGDTLKTVAKHYAEFLVSEGLVESKESKEEKISNVLASADVSTEEGFAAAVEAIVDAVKGVDAKSAAGLHCLRHRGWRDFRCRFGHSKSRRVDQEKISPTAFCGVPYSMTIALFSSAMIFSPLRKYSSSISLLPTSCAIAVIKPC